jgi:REP element-mobilizing transposase RayT
MQPARSTVREFYKVAEPLLQFPVLRFDANQRLLIGEGFDEAIRTYRYTCYACAIMPDHVHFVIRKHKHDAETMIENLQIESRSWLIENRMVPKEHPVWTKGGWKVFLNRPEEIWGRIHYVEGNPEKAGLPRQHWPFVVVYDNWPFHKDRS